MDHDNYNGELSMKRQRGRGRRPGGGGHQHNHQHQHQNPNRSMESSGPEGGKVRGPAAMIHERYLQLARDASSSGDRVLGENYLQHADHYFRLWRSTQPATPPPQQMNERFDDGAEGDDAGGDMESGDDGEMAADGDQPEVDFPSGQQPQQFDRDGERGRSRGRARRSRYRPNDGEGGESREGGEREGGEPREERQPREARDERQPREDRPPRERRERQPRERDENAGPEGFSSGPKPAFLRGGD
jgi:hypothetical protein